MAKISSSVAGKIKNLARNLKEEEDSKGAIKKLGEKIKGSTGGNKKEISDGGKLSGRKN